MSAPRVSPPGRGVRVSLCAQSVSADNLHRLHVVERVPASQDAAAAGGGEGGFTLFPSQAGGGSGGELYIRAFYMRQYQLVDAMNLRWVRARGRSGEPFGRAALGTALPLGLVARSLATLATLAASPPSPPRLPPSLSAE